MLEDRIRQLEGSPVRPEVVAALEDLRRAHGVDRSVLRVLDWGCGIGTAVQQLRGEGWTAYGADIDRDAVQRGNEILASSPLVVVDANGRTSLPDGEFDFVFSQE